MVSMATLNNRFLPYILINKTTSPISMKMAHCWNRSNLLQTPPITSSIEQKQYLQIQLYSMGNIAINASKSYRWTPVLNLLASRSSYNKNENLHQHQQQTKPIHI